MALNYANHIDATLGISYADLLERIQAKCGNAKFKLSKSKFKLIRLRRWQELATSAKLSLTEVIYAALQRMANEQDPCIEVLDGSNEIRANSELRLIKLPLQQGADALKAITKEKLMEVAESRAHSNADLQAKAIALEKENAKLKEDIEVWKAKAGAVTIEEESHEDYPECYKTLKFDFMIPRYLPHKLSRPKYRSAEMWPGIKKNLPWIDTWQVQEFQKRHSKLAPQIRADEQAGLAPKKPSDRGAESRCAVSHFFKFIKLTIGPNNKTFVPKQEHLLSKIAVNAFLTFYGQRVSSPNTANNVAKMLVNLYKHMKTMEKFLRYSAKIESLVETCHKIIQQNDELYVVYRAKKLLDTHLVLRGEWLKPGELALLTQTICTEIVEFLDRTETEEERNQLKKTELHQFQMLLILYSYLQLGGQRREVVAHFMVGNFAAVENSVIYFTLLEKVQRRNSDRLPLPSTLGQLMRIWIEKYRPLLMKENNQLKCCWVNIKGEPLSYRSITHGVISKISAIFPRRHIGPLMLRRIFVSHMSKIALENPDQYKDWATFHAPLINTSVAMYGTHYNRTNMHEQAAKTNATINTALDLAPQQQEVDAIAHHAQGVQFLDAVQDPIVKVTDERANEGDLEFLCVYQSGKEQWVSHLVMDPFNELVLAYFNSFGPEARDEEADSDEESEEEELGVREHEEASDCSAEECDSYYSVCSDSMDEDSIDDSPVVPALESDTSDHSSASSEEQSVESNCPSPVTCCNPRKRKRSKLDSIYEQLALDNREAVKPGDIISVNPEDPTADFWLAKVLSIEGKRRVHVQWMDQQRTPGRYSLVKIYDDVKVGAINELAKGYWQNSRTYVV